MEIKNIYFGVEIEGVFEGEILEEDIYYYDEDGERILRKQILPNTKYLLVKRDGSIYSSGSNFTNPLCLEFITTKLKGFNQLKDALKEFQNFISQNGKYTLKEVVEFNKSCGCHIHLSLNVKGKELKFKKLIDFSHPEALRKFFFEELSNSAKLKKEIKTNILNHYFRGYSSKTTRGNFRNHRRYSEFNLLSETEGKGFEWRSFNLLSITEWEEFQILFKIVEKSIKHLIAQIKLNKEVKKPIRIQRKDFKNLISSNNFEKIDFKYKTREKIGNIFPKKDYINTIKIKI